MNESNCGWHFHDEYSKRYHDERWCKVVHDDHELFAILIMEMMSVGLSWSLILKREEGLRQTIDHLDPEVIANYDEKKVQNNSKLHNPNSSLLIGELQKDDIIKERIK